MPQFQTFIVSQGVYLSARIYNRYKKNHQSGPSTGQRMSLANMINRTIHQLFELIQYSFFAQKAHQMFTLSGIRRLFQTRLTLHLNISLRDYYQSLVAITRLCKNIIIRAHWESITYYPKLSPFF